MEKAADSCMRADITAAFYNAAGVTKENLPFSERSEMLVNRVRKSCMAVLFPGAKTLEIGSGNGRYSFALEKMGALPAGIDCADELVAFADAYAKENSSTARFFCGDAASFPYEENAFDAAFLFSNNIVEFSPEGFGALCAGMRRALKGSGVFCVDMKDGVERMRDKPSAFSAYEPETGGMVEHYQIPGKGTYEYRCFFWTVAMAKQIGLTHFAVAEVTRLDGGSYWLVCRK